MRILLVEDNLLTAKGLKYLLEREGYTVVVATTLAEADLKLAEFSYDLALIDITLPDGEGFDFAKKLQRQHSSCALIFLTARDDETDVVHGFELGADDYIAKPFRSRELLLRIKKRLQRSTASPDSSGVLTYFPARHEVAVAGDVVVLTALESTIFSCLWDNLDHVVPRERLLDEIYAASGKVVNNNTISVYIKRLRHKLQVPGLIETVKNTGYRLRSLTPPSRSSS